MAQEKMALIDRDSQYPGMSLTKWGDPALLEVDKKFKEAQKSESEKKYKKALNCFQDCIDLSIKRKSGLIVDQYLNILLHIAYCRADSGDIAAASEIYDLRESILKEEEGWRDGLPEGLRIEDKKGYGRDELLAQNFQEKAIVRYHSGEPEKAKKYLEQSDTLFEKLKMPEGVQKNCMLLGNLAAHYENWGDLLGAGEKIKRLCGNDKESEEYMQALRYLFQAFANLEDYPKAKATIVELLTIEKMVGSPSFDDDMEFLEELKGMGY